MYRYKIILKKQYQKEIKDLRVLSRGLNRQIIKWLELGNKEILEKMKSEETLRPFNISYLSKNKDNYSFTINILDEKIGFEKILLNGIEKDSKFEIDLNYEKFELLGYEEIQALESVNLVELANEKQYCHNLRFDFITDTAFVRKGYENGRASGEYPFPDPLKIFESILNRWNMFALSKFETGDVLETISQSFSIKSAQINSDTFSLGHSEKKNMNITGFVGNLVLTSGTKDLVKKKLIYLLALYSEWSGVGKKTAFGMGQTKVSIF